VILSEARAQAWRIACAVLAVLAVAAVLVALWFRGSAAVALRGRDDAIAQRDAARAELAQAKHVTATEKAVATEHHDIGDRYDAERQAIEARAAAAESAAGRLRKLWGQCETDALAGSAAAAAAAAEQDRLREASARRIERAVELAQSERNEAVDRYEAVRTTHNAARPRD